MWNNGIWAVKLQVKGHFRITLPLPVYVLSDLLLSCEDLCSVIVTRLNQPNWVSMVRELLAALGSIPAGLPFVEVENKEVRLVCRRLI